MRTTKPLPVGTGDYRKIKNNNYYIVDKSFLIKDILDDATEVFLITRPRRFGKTLNMSMIKYFFDVTEPDAETLFKDTAISKAGARYQAEMTRYPVIFLTFKDIKQRSWADTYEGMKQIIRREFLRHKKYMITEDGDILEHEEKEYYLRICNAEADEFEYQDSLIWLTNLLERKFGQPAILLIDEYDIPIQQGYMCGFYDDVITFMRNFLSGGLKDNPHLKFAFLTGILRVAMEAKHPSESIFSGLNNLEVYSCLDNKFSTYYGFTEAEVIQLAEDYNCNKMTEIRQWYNGYRFGNETAIYNPWSVLRYIKNDFKPETYWLATSSNDIITELIQNASAETEKALQELLTGSVYSDIKTDIIYPAIDAEPRMIFSFLVMTGYLKAEYHVIDEEDHDYKLSLPNKEIAVVYRNEIVRKMEQNHERSFDDFTRTFKRAVLNNQSDVVDQMLRQIAEYTMSYYDAHENFYHGWMLSMTALFMNTHKSRSNRESGAGRFDLMLEPLNNKYPGIIFEFKVIDQCEEEDVVQLLKENAIRAYNQIEAKGYDAELRDRGISQIIKYGIAFYKKTLHVYNGQDVNK